MSDTVRIGFVEADLERAAALDAMPVDSLWMGGHIASPQERTTVTSSSTDCSTK